MPRLGARRPLVTGFADFGWEKAATRRFLVRVWAERTIRCETPAIVARTMAQTAAGKLGGLRRPVGIPRRPSRRRIEIPRRPSRRRIEMWLVAATGEAARGRSPGTGGATAMAGLA